MLWGSGRAGLFLVCGFGRDGERLLFGACRMDGIFGALGANEVSGWCFSLFWTFLFAEIMVSRDTSDESFV